MSGLAKSTECTLCPAGSYCADAYRNYPAPANPTPCPPGSYNPYNGSTSRLDCILCPPGFACPSSGLINYTLTCTEGHYCPSGTVTNTQFPCPPGTFTGSTSLTSSEECTVCPSGMACGWGTGVSTNPALPCMPGCYCPPGTASTTAHPCPAGTWSPLSNLSDSSQCTVCSAGYVCNGGLSTMTTKCTPGYYCPQGTYTFDQFPCPSGTYYPAYGSETASDCLDCPQGSFCESGSANPVQCPLGTYMNRGAYDFVNGSAVIHKILCEVACRQAPAALFDGQTGAIYSIPECFLGCQYGAIGNASACTTNSCLQGSEFWDSTIGREVVSPAAQSKADCMACPAGYTCGVGTVTPTPCSPGTYSDVGESVCHPCLAGYYCPNNATALITSLAPAVTTTQASIQMFEALYGNVIFLADN